MDTITIAKVTPGAPEEAYMGNPKSYLVDSNGTESYTFAKVFAGQSYEGNYRTDKKGNLQFKKTPVNSPYTANNPNMAQPAINMSPTNSIGKVDPNDKFAQAVERFAEVVNLLSIQLEGVKPKVETKPGLVAPPAFQRPITEQTIEEFFETENA